MSDEHTIRICAEHCVAMTGSSRRLHRFEPTPCSVVTLRRRLVVVARGAWYEPGGFGDKPNVGYIWTEDTE